MTYLKWISDDKLIAAIKKMSESIQTGRMRAAESFERNVIDPFAATFSMSLLGVSELEWKSQEINRQIDKSLSNAVGVFHQQILASVPGWQDLNNTNQVDLVNDGQKILAELKNKYNTLNAAGTVTLYKKLSDLVNSKSSKYKGYNAYYVMIIPRHKRGCNEAFAPSDNASGERCRNDVKIKIIDGPKFYALVSGEEKALENLFNIIPKVIADQKLGYPVKHNSLISELFQKAFGDF